MDFRTLRTFVEVVRQGVPLLERKGHRSTLTANGDVVHRRALKILAERDDLATELDELRGRRRYPGIDIRLVQHPGDRLKEILLSGEIELSGSLLPVSDVNEWSNGKVSF